MLDEKDLLAIANLIDAKLDEQLTPIRESLEDMNLQLENMVDPYQQDLMENLTNILETLQTLVSELNDLKIAP